MRAFPVLSWRGCIAAAFLTAVYVNAVPPACPSNLWMCHQVQNSWEALATSGPLKNITIRYTVDTTESITVDCSQRDLVGHPVAFTEDFLSGFNIRPSVSYFIIYKCRLPNITFPQLFGTRDIRRFRFTADDDIGDRLKRSFFTGMENLTAVTVEGGQITELEEDIFQDVPLLLNLSIVQNRLKTLPEKIFSKLRGLHRLDVGGNNLEALGLTLQSLTNLTLVNLYNNWISTISDETFKGLRNVDSIDLQGNRLQTLSEAAFQDLVNLRSLSLYSNHLQSIPPRLLERNSNLEVLQLHRNPNIASLPDNLLSNLTKLRELNLSSMALKNLSADFFQNNPRLETLYLSSNQLADIPPEIFNSLGEIQLLDLSKNKLSTLPTELFAGMRKLTHLNLHSNRIVQILSNVFFSPRNLIRIDLSHNQLVHIPHDSFRALDQLNFLNLSFNHLTYSSKVIITELPPIDLPNAVQTLDISRNSYSDIPTNWLSKNFNLQQLDLSYNQLETFDSESFLSATADNLAVFLRGNNISRITMDVGTANLLSMFSGESNAQYPGVKVYLGDNPVICDCNLESLLRYYENQERRNYRVKVEIQKLQCDSPNELKGVYVQYLNLEQLICNLTESCPSGCSCQWHALGRVTAVTCNNANLTSIPWVLPYNTSLLDLSNNHISSLPEFDGVSEKLENNETEVWENLTHLYLSNNDIDELTDISVLPSQLQYLRLDGNHLKRIPQSFWTALQNLSSLRTVSFNDNPWECDCTEETVNFQNWLKANARKVCNIDAVLCSRPDTQRQLNTKSIDDLQNIENLTTLNSLAVDSCEDLQNVVVTLSKASKNIPIHEADVCPQIVTSTTILVLAFSISLTVACLVAALGILYYRYKQQIKVFLYAHQMCLWFVTEDDVDKDKMYDAFVSFSQEDIEFVANQLVPNLELSAPQYKLCIHHRDWLAGEWISDQIIRSVENSRRTIVVLSNNFIRSVWGRLEFKTAHHQALKDRTNRIIMVVLGNVPPINEMDPELRMYIRFNTYLKYDDDPWFWNKLRYALPHRRVVKKQFEKTGNNLSPPPITYLGSKESDYAYWNGNKEHKNGSARTNGNVTGSTSGSSGYGTDSGLSLDTIGSQATNGTSSDVEKRTKQWKGKHRPSEDSFEL